MLKRLRLASLVVSIAALSVLALSGTAAAGSQTEGYFADPQDTNVPYVAWVGDKVRIVKCVSGVTGGVGDFALVDWSGVNSNGAESIRPSFLPSNAQSREGFSGAGEQSGRRCWDIIVTSEKPGLAKIKLETRGGSRNVTHDFLVIFLSMNQPELTELADDAYPGLEVGDPTGDGNFEPIDGEFLDGYFQVDVTGSFPLGNNYADDIPGVDSITLPDDWALLANQYGSSVRDAVDPSGWDIHDDQSTREGHVAGSGCGIPVGTREAVDNCFGGTELGRYSRIVGSTNPTVGPFDPLRPSTSYLPDGVVDEGDAPMPALRIDVGVSGGFGALASADKHLLYSRNGLGHSTAHNLYAPFYAAFIPATRAQGVIVNDLANPPLGTSSGTTGDLANNFPGFQNTERLYHYWDLLHPERRNGENDCYDVGGDDQIGDDGEGGGIMLPAGIDAATVYTDEHGQAIVRFLPDVGVELDPDDQGLCDLGEISDTPRLIATAEITAQAELPFQQAQRPIDAEPLEKNLFSLAGKSLDCVPKTPIEAFCVETIRDIRGNPVEGARVAFTREPLGKFEGAELPANDDPDATYIGPLGDSGFDTRGQVCENNRTGSFGQDQEIICRTNEHGQVGIVVKSTLPGLVDIDAENLGTRNGAFGVQRVRCLRFAGDGVSLPTDSASCVAAPTPTPTPTTPTTPSTPSTPSGNQGAVAGVSTTASIVSLAGTPIPATAAPKAKAKAAKTSLRSAKLVVIKGKRYLIVRASGAAKTVKLRIVLVMRTGKAKKAVVRTVRTNRAVRVGKLQVSKHVRTVRVSIVR